MKALQRLLFVLALSVCAGSASAATVLHLAGSPVFRSATIHAIENLLTNKQIAYATGNGVVDEFTADYCVIRGSLSDPAKAAYFSPNDVIIKVAWMGSTRGLNFITHSTDPSNCWMSATNLPGSPGTVAVTSPDYTTIDSDEPGYPLSHNRIDAIIADARQVEVGYTSSTLTETRVGVIPYVWVACNGAPASLDKMTENLAQCVLSGGAPLSQFTANPADMSTVIYATGGSFNVGSHLCSVAESGVGLTGSFQHVQVSAYSLNNTLHANQVSTIKLFASANDDTNIGSGPTRTIGNTGYFISGYVPAAIGAFDVADYMRMYMPNTVNTTTGVPAAEQVPFGPGYTVACLSRDEAYRACQQNWGSPAYPTNSAHRMTWNGIQDWNTPLTDGNPASYNNAPIKEGLSELWEYAYMSYRSDMGAAYPLQKRMADYIATEIIFGTVAYSGISLYDMHVTKAVMSGVVTHL